MSAAALLQQEASLRARIATLESEVARLRRTIERAGLSADAPPQQVSEMMHKRDHIAILHEHKRTIRKLNDELARERAANQRHAPMEEVPASLKDEPTSLKDESENTLEESDSMSQQKNWSPL
ncbi:MULTISPECIES: hypothetical protein [Achromobacter]|uniref:Uncharacterized protein n=1 Tax=Achromobacter xylosoxidans (strain A8) TaxID=762376 RepID=E3HYK4_ACHXA|nr:hypothetical protein [Achromobacter xylosoxidans]ADP20158.1 hypothetical protein AXYL_06876 [Achromobacter xylosoxidans A8]